MTRYRTTTLLLLLAIIALTCGGYGWCRLGTDGTGCGAITIIGGMTFGAVFWIVVLIGFLRSFGKKPPKVTPQ